MPDKAASDAAAQTADKGSTEPQDNTGTGGATGSTNARDDAAWAAQRKQARALKAKLAELEAENAKYKQAHETELEKVGREAREAARKELEQEYKGKEMKLKIREALAAHGPKYATLAPLVEAEEEDEIEERVKALVEQYPELKGGAVHPAVGGGGTQAAGYSKDFKDLTPEQILQLPKDKFRELVASGAADYKNKG